jgi:hypothetical protein
MIPRNSGLPARKMVRFRTHKDNQKNVKIEIVEGGDDRGINVTRIGKCIIDDIPKGTPKGSNVDVRFDYKPDGRLTIHACLPEIDRKITMTLDRAAGLTDEEIDSWMKRLDSGLSDAMLAELPQSAPESSGEIVAASGSESPRTGSPGTSNAAAVLSMSSAPTQESSGKATNRSAGERSAPLLGRPPMIDVGDKSTCETGFSANQTHPLPVPIGSCADVVREKPDLELDPKDATSASKADESDLAMLAALGGRPKMPGTTSPEVPFIVTESPVGTPKRLTTEASDKKGKPKKTGGLFGRKQK